MVAAHLVYVWRDGLAAHAHAAAVYGVPILPERQPPHHHTLLRRHHCGTRVQGEGQGGRSSGVGGSAACIHYAGMRQACRQPRTQHACRPCRRPARPPCRLERVQPSMHAKSSRMASELDWSSNSFTSGGREAGKEQQQ